MNRELRFKQTTDQRVYVSSDFHLNHTPKWPVPIWQGRGFTSVKEMNDAIIDSINASVRSTDVLLFLGDFVLNCSESEFEEFLSRINCQNIYLLFGNHNSCTWNTYQREIKNRYPYIEGDVEIYPFRYRNIVYVGNYAEVIVDGRYYVISHYPIHSWNYMKRGSIQLSGHLHGENPPVGGKRYDCAWDRDHRPYSIDEIFKMMEKIPILSDGGHH